MGKLQCPVCGETEDFTAVWFTDITCGAELDEDGQRLVFSGFDPALDFNPEEVLLIFCVGCDGLLPPVAFGVPEAEWVPAGWDEKGYYIEVNTSFGDLTIIGKMYFGAPQGKYKGECGRWYHILQQIQTVKAVEELPELLVDEAEWIREAARAKFRELRNGTDKTSG